MLDLMFCYDANLLSLQFGEYALANGFYYEKRLPNVNLL